MFNPSNIPYPAFLMCPPFQLSAKVPNNIFMKKLPPHQRVIDHKKALRQFLDLYNAVNGTAMVYLLPSKAGLQDQSYVANLGIVLPHLDDKTVVLMNTKLPERQEETEVGFKFFSMLGYKPIVAPKFWEGEAELKYVRDNLYIGQVGPHTTFSTLKWFSDNFDMHIIPLRQHDPRYYHLDCHLFPLTREKIIACPKLLEPRSVKILEKYVEIIAVDQAMIDQDIACCVRSRRLIFADTDIHEMKVTDELYSVERRKIDLLTKICAHNVLEPMFFNLSEFDKSGAGLACQLMHLNYVDYMPGRDPQGGNNGSRS